MYGGAGVHDDTDSCGGDADVDDLGGFNDDDGKVGHSAAWLFSLFWARQWQPCLFMFQARGRNLPSPLLLKAPAAPSSASYRLRFLFWAAVNIRSVTRLRGLAGWP